MSIIDIGILTGFKPEQKSLQKVRVTMIATHPKTKFFKFAKFHFFVKCRKINCTR